MAECDRRRGHHCGDQRRRQFQRYLWFTASSLCHTTAVAGAGVATTFGLTASDLWAIQKQGGENNRSICLKKGTSNLLQGHAWIGGSRRTDRGHRATRRILLRYGFCPGTAGAIADNGCVSLPPQRWPAIGGAECQRAALCRRLYWQQHVRVEGGLSEAAVAHSRAFCGAFGL